MDRKKNKVMVEGVNVRSKHVKPMKEGETGEGTVGTDGEIRCEYD